MFRRDPITRPSVNFGKIKAMESRRQIIVLACARFGFVATARVQALSAKEVYAKTADQVVTIECWNSSYIRTKQGSGIFLVRISDNPGVDILTNYHVINSS